jgi:hypothetical protein
VRVREKLDEESIKVKEMKKRGRERLRVDEKKEKREG